MTMDLDLEGRKNPGTSLNRQKIGQKSAKPDGQRCWSTVGLDRYNTSFGELGPCHIKRNDASYGLLRSQNDVVFGCLQPWLNS